MVDYRRVTDAILADARQFDIRRLTIDAKFQGVQIAQTLADQGIPVTEMSQTYTAFAAPMKELERLPKSRDAPPGGQSDPAVLPGDPRGQGRSRRRPEARQAPQSRKKDAVVSLAMALDGAIRQPLHTGSVYDQRGIKFFEFF